MFTYPICHFSETGFNPFIFDIPNSCVFNDDSLDSFSFTPGQASTGGGQTLTISFWYKRSNLGLNFTGILEAFSGSVNNGKIYFDSSNRLNIWMEQGGTTQWITSQTFKDPSAWGHIVVAWNTTDATADNRLRVYHNGTEITTWDANPVVTQNLNTRITENGILHRIGRLIEVTNHYDGYLADFIIVDGQQLLPTDFGKFDNVTGIWVPINYTGTYGNNGFRLDFADSADLGNDVSGNNNDWTLVNITSDNQVFDTPTQNHMVIPGNFPFSLTDIQDGGLLVGGTNNSNAGIVYGSFPLSSGKWYWEIDITSTVVAGTFGTYPGIGCIRVPYSLNTYNSSGSAGMFPGRAVTVEPDGFSYDADGDLNDFGTNNSALFNTFAQNDVIQVALDLDNGNVWFGKNNTWQGAGSPDPATGTDPAISSLTGSYIPSISVFTNTREYQLNFGQRNFTYTPPSDFNALNTINLLAPEVRVPTDAFDARSYLGTGAVQDISGFDFAPNIVWIKNRDAGDNWKGLDTTRGATNVWEIDLLQSEIVEADGLTAFNSDGFSLGTNTTYNTLNENYSSLVWNVNPRFGIDIVTYTGNGVVRTISHNLGAVPEMMIVKNLQSGGNGDRLYHHEASANPEQNFLILAGQQALQTGTPEWNDTAPTATEFTVGTDALTNGVDDPHIAYLFRSVPGFSKIGSYIGNGSSNGALVSLGFRPKFIFGKRTNNNNSWFSKSLILDPGFNTFTTLLYPDLQNSETTDGAGDFLSSGVKWLANDPNTNANNALYIYAAFADLPTNWAGAL